MTGGNELRWSFTQTADEWPEMQVVSLTTSTYTLFGPFLRDAFTDVNTYNIKKL